MFDTDVYLVMVLHTDSNNYEAKTYKTYEAARIAFRALIGDIILELMKYGKTDEDGTAISLKREIDESYIDKWWLQGLEGERIREVPKDADGFEAIGDFIEFYTDGYAYSIKKITHRGQ